MKLTDLNAQTIGDIGVHLTVAELLKRGYVTVMTSKNIEGPDILCSRSNGSKAVTIQVKTTRQKPSWLIGSKAEKISSPTFFYVFVDLNGDKTSPNFYVVPSRVVAAYISKSHKTWLVLPGKGGKKHKDTSMRVFDLFVLGSWWSWKDSQDKEQKKEAANYKRKYQNAWHLLNL